MIAPKIVNGDIVIENGEWVWVEGDQELAQSIESELMTRRGEFFLEEDFGLRHENLFGKHTNEHALRDDLVEAISHEERVQSVRDIFIVDDKKNRHRTVHLTIEKENNEIIQINDVLLGEGGS